MTICDDEVLAAELQAAAAAVQVPSDGPKRILDSARSATASAPIGVVHSLLPRRRSLRISLGAAAAVLVALAVSLPLVQTSTKAPSHSNALGFGLPSTTVPFYPGSTVRQFEGATALRTRTDAGLFAASGASPAPGSLKDVGAQSLNQSVAQPAKVEANGAVALTIAAGALQRDLARLTSLSASLGGYVASTHVQVGSGSNQNASSGTIVLRVPEVRFGRLVSRVQRVGHVTAVRTTSTDVTSQYVDLQARIAALEISRQQYLTIMAKAHTVSEILSIQSQVNNIQSQIEQLKGERNALNNETAYGTLQVSLIQQGQQPNGRPAAGSGVATAWHQSVRGFVVGFEWLIRIAGPTLFVLLCLLALFFLGRSAWRATRRRMI